MEPTEMEMRSQNRLDDEQRADRPTWGDKPPTSEELDAMFAALGTTDPFRGSSRG